MALTFGILAILALAGALAAVSLRNLIHCALALVVSFAGLAALYLQLNAQFVGFAQILVYIGAVAILVVFAILLTRGIEPPGQSLLSSSWWVGVVAAGAIFAVLGGVVLSTRALDHKTVHPATVTVRDLGNELMTKYILPLEVLGLLLTAALIGAVIIAFREKEKV